MSFISSFKETDQTVTRFNHKKKTKIGVPCPTVVMQYNRHMRGVNLLDGNLEIYKMKIRSQRAVLLFGR